MKPNRIRCAHTILKDRVDKIYDTVDVLKSEVGSREGKIKYLMDQVEALKDQVSLLVEGYLCLRKLIADNSVDITHLFELVTGIIEVLGMQDSSNKRILKMMEGNLGVLKSIRDLMVSGTGRVN